MNTICKLIIFCIIIYAGVGCWSKGKKIPDVSHIKIDVNIDRFEKILFAIDTNDIKGSMDALTQKYPDIQRQY